jgi:serine/threonine protein kinase
MVHSQLVRATDEFATVLGRGAFATVYLGKIGGKRVAVKVDSPELLKEGEKTRLMLEQQYIYELTMLYTYSHPNICALIAHCTDGPTRSLVYEYCAKGNLLDRIAAKNTPLLTWPQRLRITVGIAKGLAFLHSVLPNPLVHRDVKTANILLSADLEAKVSDFGTIREQKRGLHTNIANAETHFTTKMVIGTESYMAPEYSKYGKVGPKLDAFAFGVCALELMSGRQPNENLLEVFDAHESLATVAEALDSRVGDWVLEDALVIVQIGIQCQETLTSRRLSTIDALAQLEGLL